MIAVTAASGHLGRLSVRLLLEHVDADRVVALSRTPQALTDLGAATRYADFDDPSSLVAAFDGAERLLLVGTNVFDPPDQRIRQHTNAVRLDDPGSPVPLSTTTACALIADEPVANNAGR